MMWRMCGLLVVILLWGNVLDTVWLGPPLQATTAALLSSETIGKDGAPMMLIPAGPFLMGVPTWARDGGRDEYPNHKVDLPAYFIDKYEVTNGRYLEFIRGNRSPCAQALFRCYQGLMARGADAGVHCPVTGDQRRLV